MDNEQNLANLSISLSAKDVNVKDMFDNLKKEALNLQKEISGAFDMSEIKNAVSDMRKMTSELKGATTQVTALSNSMRQSANDLKSISKETGFKKLKKDIDNTSQSTKKIDFSKIISGLQSINGFSKTNLFGNFTRDTELLQKTANELNKTNSELRRFWEISSTLDSVDYSDMTGDLGKMYEEWWRLSDSVLKYQSTLKNNQPIFDENTIYRISSVRTALYNIVNALNTSINTVKNFGVIIAQTLGSMPSAFSKVASAIVSRFSDKFPGIFDMITSNVDRLRGSFSSLGGASGVADTLQKAFSNGSKSVSKMASGFKGLVKSITSFNKESKKASTHTYTFSRMMKDFARNLVLYGFAMRGIMSVVNAMGTTMWGALNTNEQFVASLNNIKANLAVAFMPIYNTILPAINALMSALAGITRIIGSLFASLFGSSYDEMLAQANKLFGQIKANEEAEKGGADAVKDKTKEYKKQLLAVDEINNLTLDQDTSGSGGGGSGGAETDFEQLEGFGVNVDALKKKLEELFQPIKNSWDKYGKGVIDSVKYSFSEIWELIKSIGRSFEEVWLNGTGEQTFDYIFQILTIIFNIIGDIAKALREAWEENNTGTKIVQALWNSFNNVLEIVERLTRAIQDWSRQADFTNMMNSVLNLSIAFEKLTGSIRDTLVPIFDTYLTPTLNYLTEVAIPSVINGISYLVNFFSEHLGSLALIVGSVLGAKLFAPLITGLQTVTKSPAFSLLSSIFSSIAGAVGVVSTSIGLLTTTFAGMATKIPILGEPIALVMDKIGKAMIGLNGAVLLLVGGFFYLLGSSEEMTTWVNGIVDAFNKLISSIDFSKIAKQFSKGIKDILSTISNGINNFDWKSVGKILSDSISGIFNFIGNINFGDIYSGISQVINSMVSALTQTIDGVDWASIGSSLVTGITNLLFMALNFLVSFDWLGFVLNVFTLIGTAISGMAEFLFGAITSLFSSVLTSVSEFLINVGNSIGVDLIQGLLNGIVSVINMIVDKFNELVQWIKDLLGIHSPSTVFEDIGINIILGLFNGISSIIQTVLDLFVKLVNSILSSFEGLNNFIKTYVIPAVQSIGNIWNNIWKNYLQPFINWVSSTFSPLFKSAMSVITSVTNTVKSTISSVWNGIKSIFNGIINFVTGTFTGNWKKAWNGVKSIFKSIWNTFYSIVKAPINLVIGAINAMISGIEKGINYVIGAINKLSFDVPDWVPGIGGQTWGFSIGKVKFGRIPKLEEGGIAYGDTLVNVAEYVGARANPEVIAPLDKLNGMIYDGISELMKNNTNNQFNPNDYDIVTEVELKVGEEQIAKATAKGKAKIEKKTGRPLFNT